MNAKQSLREASKRIIELEDFNRRSSSDIKAYNACIIDMINGGNPCRWCNERELNECEHPELDGKGCDTWWLADHPVFNDQEGSETDESKGILLTGAESGE